MLKHGGLLALAAAFALMPSTRAALPHPDHVVIVIMENHSFGQVIGNSAAPSSIDAQSVTQLSLGLRAAVHRS